MKSKKNPLLLIIFAMCAIISFVGIQPVCVKAAESVPSIVYSAHVQNKGWLPSVSAGQTGGTTGLALPMESFWLEIKNSAYKNNILYRSHIRNLGWETEWRTSGQISGTTGLATPLECVQIKLTGALAEKYDIYYRLHCQNYGWLGWARNGASAGTTGGAVPAEAIQIKLVPKGTSVNQGGTAYIDASPKPVVTEAELINNVQKVFNAIKNKKSSWNGKCAALVYWQLVQKKLLSEADPSAEYGYQMAKKYANMKKSAAGASMTGYTCQKSTSAATLDRIIAAGNGRAENIVVSFDSGSGLSSAGHVMLISKIENGKVYFVDNTSYCKGSDGQYKAISMTLQQYKSKYLSQWSANCMTVIKK